MSEVRVFTGAVAVLAASCVVAAELPAVAAFLNLWLGGGLIALSAMWVGGHVARWAWTELQLDLECRRSVTQRPTFEGIRTPDA